MVIVAEEPKYVSVKNNDAPNNTAVAFAVVEELVIVKFNSGASIAPGPSTFNAGFPPSKFIAGSPSAESQPSIPENDSCNELRYSAVLNFFSFFIVCFFCL